QVRAEFERQAAASGCTYMTCRLRFGEMTEARAAANADLFVAEVMPHLTALAFAAQGADLILNTRANRDELEEVAEECRKRGVHVAAVLGDIGDADAV